MNKHTVRNEVLNAKPMVKVFERSQNVSNGSGIFVPFDGKTHAFKLNRRKEHVNFDDSDYGKVVASPRPPRPQTDGHATLKRR